VGAALVKKGINPVPFLVALAAACNIGAGATLIGNAQNMMIGQLANLGFLSYILWAFVPVVVGLVAIYGVTRVGARFAPAAFASCEIEPPAPPYPLDAYHTAKGLVVLAVVIGLFFTSLPKEVVVLVAAGIHLLSRKFRTEELLKLVDWQLLVLFMALFVVSGTFEVTGYGTQLVQWLEKSGFDPSRPANEVALTAGLTALINNAPAVMLLLKLVPVTHVSIAYVMAVANSFAGSSIMTASVANLVVVQQARTQGIVISFWDFARLGIPITLLSLGGLIGWAVLMGP
jgi:Na+/H+ antiporter NhaD/arsenite permease-like protein